MLGFGALGEIALGEADNSLDNFVVKSAEDSFIVVYAETAVAEVDLGGGVFGAIREAADEFLVRFDEISDALVSVDTEDELSVSIAFEKVFVPAPRERTISVPRQRRTITVYPTERRL